MQRYILSQRNLLYTAVTRGRNNVFIVGHPKGYIIAVDNKKPSKKIFFQKISKQTMQ
jgi:exodeoxyribonuclease V alpha subunit